MRLRALNSFIVSFHRLHLHRTSAIVLGEKKKKKVKAGSDRLTFSGKKGEKTRNRRLFGTRCETDDSSERERELMRKGEQKCHVEQYNLRRGNK